MIDSPQQLHTKLLPSIIVLEKYFWILHILLIEIATLETFKSASVFTILE
jgi:hypothetical protein